MRFWFNKFKKQSGNKTIIIRSDGGICSQIEFCCLGLCLQDLGYKVKYDLSWFDENGLDCNGKFVRNYDMPLAFPNLKLEIATDKEIKQYKKLKKFIDTIPLNNESGYICGYPPERGKNLIKYRRFLVDNFKPVDINLCDVLLKNIRKSRGTCGVHVRRGDLSVYNPAYGYPTPKEYYIKAIKILHIFKPDVKFFFFSEECDWIKSEIIPNLDFEIEYEICDKNGADKGYLDLYLMSKCDHLITSSGSLGRIAKILSDKQDGFVFLDRYYANIVENYKNVIILNDTVILNKSN